MEERHSLKFRVILELMEREKIMGAGIAVSPLTAHLSSTLKVDFSLGYPSKHLSFMPLPVVQNLSRDNEQKMDSNVLSGPHQY